MTYGHFAAVLANLLLLAVFPASAEPSLNVAAPLTDPVLESPTLHSIGLHWVIQGDANGNAAIETSYRTGDGEWRKGQPLLRVESGAHKLEKGSGSVEVPAGTRLFAGSLLQLEPATDYEVKLTLVDSDGGSTERHLKARTRAEPKAPADAKVYHVIPGKSGGTGTAEDPFRGLQSANSHARPGTIFLLHAGIYPAPFVARKSGEPGRPVVWRAAGDGEAIIDGGTKGGEVESRLISADESHDIWFEGLTIRNGGKGVAANGSARIVVRGCHIHEVEFGIFATLNTGDTMRDWFVSDNVIEGPSTWPRTKGIESARGVQLTGEGHVVCYNRIRGFADAINTFRSVRCASIDFHNNEISEMTDDGVELDYSERNVRCFHNRFTNVFQGISVQPIYGGPAYVFHNALYNVEAEPFKMHNSPSGALFYHNTVVKHGPPLILMTSKPVRNSRTRNNLFIGRGGNYAFESSARMEDCDFDYDGVGGGPWKLFLKWNGQRYATLDEVRKKAPVWHHTAVVDAASVFASGVQAPANPKETLAAVDLRLKPGTSAIDAGEPLPGVNDGFAGSAPDLGAYEAGAPLPHYGPRTTK